jgi:predicted transposase/invertase (TIGR01784 family)
MTFAQQLEQRGLHQGLEQGLKQGRQQGLQQGFEKAQHEVARNLLAEGMDLDLVKKVTKLSDLDLTLETH